MVTDLNKIIDSKDFYNEQESKNLVFLCANNQDLDLPFALLTSYQVFDAYAEYWEKGRAVLEKNKELLDDLYKVVPASVIPYSEKNTLSKYSRLKLQKKGVKKYLEDYPLKEKLI